MKMEGDPHVTAWGVMRGQALDLITPQQVVGGLFLMNAEEKGCIALQPRLEILDEQGELMSAPHPLLSPHDQPLLGAGEGQQLVAGRCQSLCATTEPWTGEHGRLTLCTLNILPPDSAQNPPSLIYKHSMDDQMPPLIIVPSENAHMPLCPAPFSQESEHNLEVNIPQSADYLLDVHSSLIPKHESDRDAYDDCRVPALDSHQVPVPIDSLSSDLEQMPQFTSNMRQAGEVPLTNDQTTPGESCLPLKMDQPCRDEPLLDPDAELFPHYHSNHSQLGPSLDYKIKQLPWSETLVDMQDTEIERLPQPESHVVAQFPQSETSQFDPCLIPQSESDVEPDPKELPQTKSIVDSQINSCLVPDPDQLPQFEPLVDMHDTDIELLPQPESHLVDQFPRSETSQLPQFDPCLVPHSESDGEYDPKQLPKTKSIVDSQINSCLVPDPDQLPWSGPLVDMQDTEIEQLPQSESHLVANIDQFPQSETSHLPQFDPCLVPQSESYVEPDPKQLLLAESFVDSRINSCLVPDPDQLPRPESNLNPDQLPPSKSIVGNKEHSQSHPDLAPDTNQLHQSGPQFDLDPEHLPLVTEEFCQSKSHLGPDTEEVALSKPYFDTVIDYLPQSEIECCLTPDPDLPLPSETPLVVETMEPESCVTRDAELLPEFITNLKSELLSSPENSMTSEAGQLPHSGYCLEPNTGPLPLYDFQHGSCLSANHENLPHSQPVRDCDADPLSYFCPETEKITQPDPLDSDELFESEWDLHIDHSHRCLDSDIETFHLAESFMAHDTEQSIESLVPTTDQLAQPKFCLDSNLPDTKSYINHGYVHLQQKLPHPVSDKVSSNDQLPHSELSLDVDKIPNSGSFLDHDPDWLPWFEFSMCANTARLPFSTHNLNEGGTSMAHEADELSLCDPFLAPDHYEFSVSNSATSITDQLTLGDRDLEPDDEQRPICEFSVSDMGHKTLPGPLMVNNFDNLHQSEAFLTPDPEHLLQSESILDRDTDRLSEFSLDSDNDQTEIFLDHLPLPSPSGTVDFEQLPVLQYSLTNNSEQLEVYASSMVPVTDQLLLVNSCMELDGRHNHEFESCLTTDDDDLFFLSETFLSHHMDQIPKLDHSMTPETDQLSSSKPLSPDNDQTEPCRPPVFDRLHQSESCLSPDNDQLTLSESPLSPHNDQIPQFDYCLGPSINKLTKVEYCTHPQNKLLPRESPLSPDSDQSAQSEPCLDADDHPLTQLEPCLRPNIDQLPPSESCLCQETECLPQFAFKRSLENDNLSDAFLGSDNDELSYFESPLYPNSDQLAQTEQHLVPDSEHLPQLESDELSQCESNVCVNSKPFSHSVPHTGQMTQLETLFHHDLNQFPLSECLLAPNTAELHVCESNDAHDQIHRASSPSCPSPVISLAHNPDPLFVSSVSPSIQCPLFETPPTPDTGHLPLSESLLTPNLDMLPLAELTNVPTTGEMSFFKSSLAPVDHFEFSVSSVPPSTTQLLTHECLIPHSTVHLPLFDQLTFAEPSESPTTPHLPPSETPGTPKSTSVPLCDASVTLNTPSNTNFPSKTLEDFQFPWDWTLNLHQTGLPEVNLDFDTDLSLNSPKEPKDSFSIFCLDTPPESSDGTPDADLTLSDDLLSLCDVFSHLQTNSQSDQSPMSTNGQTDFHVETDQSLNTIFQKELEPNPPSKPSTFHNATTPLDHGFLNSDGEQSDFYCLDLLFDPSRSLPNPTANEPHLQPNPRTSTENVDSTDSTNCETSLFCSESQIYRNGSPLLEKSLTSKTSDGSLLSRSESPLFSSRYGPSSSQLVIDVGSLSLESPSESTPLPVIVVTDPLESLSDSDDHTKSILAKSTNALPSDMYASAELETDSHFKVMEVPSCDLPDTSDVKRLPTDYLDASSELSLCDGPAPSQEPQSDSILGTTLPSFLSTGELPLTRTGSPFESMKLRSHDSQDSASALMQFGEGDPLLGFSLDNDSPCAGDELARLRAVFDALDRDKDGFVKMEDFVQFATVYGAEQVKYLTGYLDPAGLGLINFRDFYRGISEIQNEDLDMQLYDMGYPSEEEPACSVDFDDLAAFEVTEVTDSAYVGSESAYSECETFTDEDTGGLAAQEDHEAEGDGTGSRGHARATPEGLELSLCDISGVTVTGHEEQFEDFGEGAEPDLFNNHCEEEQESFTQTTNTSQRLTSSPDKRTSSRKEARRLHHSGFLEDQGEQPLTDMAYDDTDLTDKVLYLEQRVSELERDAAMTGEQQNRLKQENLHLLHRAHALEEQLKDQEVRSDEVQGEETRKHRDELRKMERDRGFRLSSLKARVQELENENVELHSQLPSAKATTQRLEEEKYKLLDEVEELQRQLTDHQEQNKKLGGKLSKEKHKQQTEKERCQEVIEELRRELEQTQLLRLEMEQRMGLGNTAALQEYNSRTKESEMEQEVRRLKQEQRLLKEQNEELNGQIINLSIQGAKNLFSTTFSDSLAAEISSVSRDELMEAIQKQEEINLRLQDYIDRIIVAIMETNPAILEVKIH
ncbi:rab11 family-interacting protein 3 isoform X2 [Rhinoderma darwinii]|uniref:rab11 family-interacting protein 3 isoform X2 n=1 Tax=Rhinoderma darwinii TaxID=43563 RepID=UPI003F677404